MAYGVTRPQWVSNPESVCYFVIPEDSDKTDQAQTTTCLKCEKISLRYMYKEDASHGIDMIRNFFNT